MSPINGRSNELEFVSWPFSQIGCSLGSPLNLSGLALPTPLPPLHTLLLKMSLLWGRSQNLFTCYTNLKPQRPENSWDPEINKTKIILFKEPEIWWQRKTCQPHIITGVLMEIQTASKTEGMPNSIQRSQERLHRVLGISAGFTG